MPKVSIIVPVYNVEKYLSQCVDSLVNQTLKDIEVILVDDESPDNCPAICDEYARQDPRVKVIHKKNEGQGIGRNAGLNIATGEYIAFVDSDDYLELDAYQKLYDYATETKADAVYFNYRRFDEQGNAWIDYPSRKATRYHTEEDMRKLILDIIATGPEAESDRGDIICAIWCTLYRHDVIRNFKIRFKCIRELVSEDLLFNLDYLVHSSNVFTINDIFYNYRKLPTSYCQTFHKIGLDRYYALYQYLLEWLEKNNFGKDGYFRATRNLFSYIRMAIEQCHQSSRTKKEKLQWFKELTSHHYWKQIAAEYPYRKLPKNQALQFYLIHKNYSYLLYYHEKIYNIYTMLISMVKSSLHFKQ